MDGPYATATIDIRGNSFLSTMKWCITLLVVHTMYTVYYKYTLNVFTKLEYGISLDRVYAYIIQGFIFLIWLKAN